MNLERVTNLKVPDGHSIPALSVSPDSPRSGAVLLHPYARGFGLPISETMPLDIYHLMDLYPQTGIGRPSVLYVPFRRAPAARAEPATLPSPPSGPQPAPEQKH